MDTKLSEYVVIIFGMILGALPFGFHYAFVRKKFMSFQINKEVALYFGILGVASTVFVVSMDVNPIDGVFNLVSGSTTTGFQTISLKSLNWAAGTVLITVMIVGGCGFSTAGGLKVYRLFALANIKSIRKKISRSGKNEIIAAVILVAALPIIPLFVANHMSSLGYDYGDSYFDAVSALTTTGLGTGTISGQLDSYTLILFAFLMIFGRIEVILLLYLFIPKLIP
jgi:trk system potassium uptake protein